MSCAAILFALATSKASASLILRGRMGSLQLPLLKKQPYALLQVCQFMPHGWLIDSGTCYGIETRHGCIFFSKESPCCLFVYRAYLALQARGQFPIPGHLSINQARLNSHPRMRSPLSSSPLSLLPAQSIVRHSCRTLSLHGLLRIQVAILLFAAQPSF